MNLDEFSYEENGRRYIDPNVSLNEQNAFIQNLRDTQAQRNAQIAQQTHDLGTDVPSNLGGLTGSEAYFNARYQTPQTNSIVADLKTTAQAQALNTALSNELEKAKKRYSDAYKAAQARVNGSGGGTNSDDDTVEGEVSFVSTGGEESDFWSTGNIGEDKAFYGLLELKRNPGESQSDWKKRAEQWIYTESLKRQDKIDFADLLRRQAPDTYTTKDIARKRMERAYENYLNSWQHNSMTFQQWLAQNYPAEEIKSMLTGE